MNVTTILLIIINFAGALAVFLFAMKMMSEGLQKVAGSKMRAVLGRMTGKPLSGILTGTAVTAAIQSSSATTVMVVSFVNAGLLSLGGAIAVIMGANIGTTVTAWIITLLGLGSGSGYFDLPLLIAAASLAFFFMKRDKMHSVGQTIIGLALLLVGMRCLQSAMPDLSNYPSLLHGLASLSGYGFWSVLLFVAIGAVMTCMVQASAATMAITLLMLHNGWIGLDVAIALVMGENIGTTVTANVAATVAGIAGKRAARAHFVFNVLGVTLTLILFRPILSVVQLVFPNDAPMALSLFHTMFNVMNVSIQSWFIPQIVWIVTRMVPEKKKKNESDDYRLTYISRGPVDTAELNLQSAKKELQLFSKQVLRMYALLPELRTVKNAKEMDAVVKRIAQYERLTDRMDMEISKFLVAVGGGSISGHGSERISTMLRISDNLESIGDSIYQIALTRKNKYSNAVHFNETQNTNLAEMSALVENALLVMDGNLVNYDHANIRAAEDAERDVNACRDRLREEHLDALRHNRYGYEVGNAYSSLFAQYEKLADYIINVSESIDPSFKKS
ncbi:MAG: Na/Pi cotransporter family protein [Bacteroidales bacterium]|nr:Na/Pi cotransporter family protein [Bacteroidales bacterium]